MDNCITRKILLKSVIKDDTLFNNINHMVINVNKITTLTYQFIKLYYLYQLQHNLPVPVINKNFICQSMNIVSVKNDKRGKPPSNDYNYKNMLKYFNTHFKKIIPEDQIVSNYHCNFIFNYSAVTMLTAYNNNIIYNYFQRLKKYLYTTVTNEFNITTDKTEIRKIVNDLYNRLLNNINDENYQYNDWVKENINKLLPTLKSKKGHFYNIKIHPQSYFNGMVHMNKYLEFHDQRLFNCFPLRNSCIPKHIEIDTATLLTLTSTNGIGNKLKKLVSNKIIWDDYFKTDKKCFKSNKKVTMKNNKKGIYKFEGNIQTDGVSVSIRLSLVDIETGKKIKTTGNRSKKEFLYLDELENDELDIVKKSNRVYIDPGKKNIIYCMDEEGKTLSYSSKQRLSETNRLVYNEIIKKEKKSNNINTIEEKLSLENSKSCNYNKFIEFVKNKNKVNSKISKFYEEKLFRNLIFRSKSLTKKSEQNLVNKIKELYGNDCVLLYGDKNIGKQMRHLISSPMIGFKKMLDKEFKVYNVDEFRSSCLDYRTTDDKLITAKCKMVKMNVEKSRNVDKQMLYKNKIFLKKKMRFTKTDTGYKRIIKNWIAKKLTAILVSQISNESCKNSFYSYQNRDRNAVLNIKKLVNYELENGKGSRPYWYRRDIKLVSGNNS